MRDSRARTRPAARLGLRLAACVLGAAIVSAAPAAERHLRAAAVLERLGQTPDATQQAAPRELSLSIDGARVRAHLYLPAQRTAPPGIVLLHGAHPRGIDEPRLVAFARSLANAGVAVLAPELPELMAYRIDASTIERIATLARIHAAQIGVPAVGVMGISFAGGLALIAAAKAHDRSAIAFVVSVGGHHDLARLTRYYAGAHVAGPHGERVDVAAHPYGARVLLREHLERFFDAQDLAVARIALDTYLHDEHTQARKQAERLSARGRETMRVLLDSRAGAQLASMLQRAADDAHAELAKASPRGQLAGLQVPVFLVHGSDDPIIPSIETLWLAAELPRALRREVVVSPVLRHAELRAEPTLADTWALVHFMACVLREADAERFTRPRTSHAR